MATASPLLDLPVELLLSIFPYLDLPSFLNLTSTCHALHDRALLYDAQYWSSLLRSTFRVPNQPAAENDGERWHKLFKRMHTQTRIFTWGDNTNGCLGHSTDELKWTRSDSLRRRHVSWPEKMVRVEDLGVVADLQCGGWSTTLLTAKGALYTVGSIDGGGNGVHDPNSTGQTTRAGPLPLRYPPGYPHPYDRYDASTAIKQFSSGRSHILGLTDSGRIWSWQHIEHAALHVKFIQHDTVEDGRSRGQGVVKKVVAGWDKSAALIEGTGIVVWDPLRRGVDDHEIEDAALVLESVVVPKTGFVEKDRHAKPRRQAGGNPGTELVGEVRNFVVLEEVIVFNTHLGKVFCSQVFWNERGQMISKPIELVLPRDPDGQPAFATDVQGSFRSFGVFTRSGAVLTSKKDRLMELLNRTQSDKQLFTLIPALQGSGVIQLAFGDHHFHALHSSGHITSYGHEPQRCGALGLGGHGSPDGRLRGIRYTSASGDGRLIPHTYMKGRRIWFQREKRAWINFITSGGVDPGEAQDRIRLAIGVPAIQCQGEISEWVEQQGQDWEAKFGVQSQHDDGLGAYFALSVTAAGWHSGALILENAELAEKLRRACEVPDPTFQRVVTNFETHETGDAAEAASSVLGFAIAAAADWGRWTIGMPPYDAQSLARPSQDRVGETAHMAQYKLGMHPINFGAAPRVGCLYKVSSSPSSWWARDSVDANPWRSGRMITSRVCGSATAQRCRVRCHLIPGDMIGQTGISILRCDGITLPVRSGMTWRMSNKLNVIARSLES